MKNKYIGGSLDEFLKEEGILAETEATAAKRVNAYQIQAMMKKKKLLKKKQHSR